jgi:hypothetical protein
LLQELPGGADERPALLVLVVAGRLTDEQDLRVHRAFARDGPSALGAEGTGTAGMDAGVETAEGATSLFNVQGRASKQKKAHDAPSLSRWLNVRRLDMVTP